MSPIDNLLLFYHLFFNSQAEFNSPSPQAVDDFFYTVENYTSAKNKMLISARNVRNLM
jgi:hypothetical protein